MEFNYKNKYSLKVITHRNPRLFPLEKKSNIYHNMKVHKNESRVIITVFIEHILSRNQHAARLHIVFNMDSPKRQNHLDLFIRYHPHLFHHLIYFPHLCTKVPLCYIPLRLHMPSWHLAAHEVVVKYHSLHHVWHSSSEMGPF